MAAELTLELEMDQGCDWGGLNDLGSRINYATRATPTAAVVNVDLSGYSARMKVRALPGGAELLSLTQASGITLGDGTGTSNIDIDVTNAQTLAMPAGLHGVDLLLIDGGGTIRKFFTGSCRVKPTYSVP